MAVCWKLDRLGRNLKHLVKVIDDLQGFGVSFAPVTHPRGSGGVRARQNPRARGCGAATVRAKGKQLGRPVDAELHTRIAACAGLSVREAARRVGCSTRQFRRCGSSLRDAVSLAVTSGPGFGFRPGAVERGRARAQAHRAPLTDRSEPRISRIGENTEGIRTNRR